MEKRSVQLGRLDGATNILKSLLQERLPFKASYWLRRNIDNVSKVYQPFMESKIALLKECAELDTKGDFVLAEDGINIKIMESKKEEFWKQYKELAEKEVEVDIMPLKLEYFDKVEITVPELVQVDFILEEPTGD